jgi:putative addiction module component (TIGR02574 family)
MMRANEIKHEVDQLAMSEKLLLVEEIWDSIALSNDQIPLHEWQKAELDKRYAEYQQGNQSLHIMKNKAGRKHKITK